MSQFVNKRKEHIEKQQLANIQDEKQYEKRTLDQINDIIITTF